MGRSERSESWGASAVRVALEALVTAGLEVLIGSGVLVAVVIGALAILRQDRTVVLGAAAAAFFVLFVLALAYAVSLQRRNRSLLVDHVAAVDTRATADHLEKLIQQLRAVDLEMTALRCYGRTDPEQSPEETRRDCVRVVLRPVYNQLLNEKRGSVSVAFHEWRADRQRFSHVVATPEFRPADRDVVARLDKDSAAARALAEGEPNIVPNVASPDARRRGWKQIPGHPESGSSIQVPVYRIGGKVDGEWLGVISADCSTTNAFTSTDGDLLLEFAVKVTVIYESMFEPAGSD